MANNTQQGGSVDQLLDIFKSIAGLSSQNQGQQSSGNPMQQATQAVAQQLNPYQKGVEKALKEGGYAHVQEALAAGVPAEQIVQQSGLNSNMPQQPQGQPMQQQSQPEQTPQQQKISQQGNSPMQILKGILPMLNLPEMVSNTMAQQGLKTERMGLQNQAMQQQVSGQEPIQPIQKQEMQARVFSAQREAVQGEITAANDQLKASIDQLSTLSKLPLNVRWGKEKTLLKNIDIAQNNLKKSLDRMKSLSSNKGSIPKGATHYSPSQNKFYDSKGNEVK